MRVRRALARLCGRGRPRSQATQTYPCKPIKGEGIRRLQFAIDFWLPALFTFPISPMRYCLRQKDEIRNLPL